MKPRRLRSFISRCGALYCAAALFYAVPFAPAHAAADARIAISRADVLHHYDSCYRYGRCSADDLRRLRDRLQRLDRVAPQPPSPEPMGAIQSRAHVPPTSVDQIRPAYRDSSQLREAWRDKAAESPERKVESEKR